MNEHEKNNLEELLSSYIDGELSERQCNEVRRLVGHSDEAAAILKQLQKNKALLGSLSRAQAPAHLFDNVRASLERSVLLDEYHGKQSIKAGIVHLYTRKMIAAAAMIALVGALGFVIYNITKQDSPSKQITVNTNWQKMPEKAVVKSLAKMELQLQTDQATAVNQFIYRNIILDNGLQNSATIKDDTDKKVYAISCSRASAQMVLEGLGMIWDKFKGTQLLIDGLEMPVTDVTVAQAIEIAKEPSAQEQIKLAKEFFAANKERIEPPVAAVVAADSNGTPEVMIIKPALAGGAAKPGPNEPADTQKINLTIIVTGK
jgi:negative regulator of sigma E activity